MRARVSPDTGRFPDSACLDGMEWVAVNARYKRFTDVPPGAKGRMRISFHKPGKKKIYPLMKRLFTYKEYMAWVKSGQVGEIWNYRYKGRS